MLHSRRIWRQAVAEASAIRGGQVRQLTGTAGERAVPGAKLGLVTGFGMVTYDRCLCTGAAVLARTS